MMPQPPFRIGIRRYSVRVLKTLTHYLPYCSLEVIETSAQPYAALLCWVLPCAPPPATVCRHREATDTGAWTESAQDGSRKTLTLKAARSLLGAPIGGYSMLKALSPVFLLDFLLNAPETVHLILSTTLSCIEMSAMPTSLELWITSWLIRHHCDTSHDSCHHFGHKTRVNKMQVA